jgi:hypothetical protein
MDWLDLLQWPAMAVTVGATWLIASSSRAKRRAGFWFFLASNVLWVVWGWHAQAYAIIALQFVLAALNIRGMNKNDPHAHARSAESSASKPAAQGMALMQSHALNKAAL